MRNAEDSKGGKMNEIEKIDSIRTALATITQVQEARKLLSIAEGLVIATRREYKASNIVSEVKEDRDKAYNTGVKAGELRLLAEAKLGELIKKEQEKGKLASQNSGRPKKYRNDSILLKDLGLNPDDSYRAQRISEYQDLIPKVVAKAVARGDIPTRKDMEFAIREKKRNSTDETRVEINEHLEESWCTSSLEPWAVVKEKYGFLPLSVMEFDQVPPKWREVDLRLKLDVCKGWRSDYTLGLLYSKFSYGLAEFVVRYWSEEGDLILDPFMGWGVRGAVATMLGRSYWGYEVSPTMFDKTRRFLNIDGVKEKIELVMGDGLKLEQGPDAADLIFTCPPYWNLEKYESVPRQISDCSTYEEFLAMLSKGFEKYNEVLKKGKFCVFVVSDFRKDGFKLLHRDVIGMAEKVGLKIWDILISVRKNPFVWKQIARCDKQRYTSNSHEYILVFRK